MSNSPDNDRELSALLQKAEPPKSPAHLDEAILRYAREHAPASKQSLSGNWSWLQRHWVSAAATFSVAAIAISVSLPFFSDPQSVNSPTISRTQELALGISASSAVAEADAKALAAVLDERQSLEPQAIQPQAPAPAQEARLRQEFAAADTDAVADRTITATAATADANVATRRANAAAPAATSVPAPELAEMVRDDVALQDTVIIALRRALGVREQSAVVRRGRFTDEISIYIETWRGLRDSVILANVQNRYSVARADLLDARLPETVAELVSLLETL